MTTKEDSDLTSADITSPNFPSNYHQTGNGTVNGIQNGGGPGDISENTTSGTIERNTDENDGNEKFKSLLPFCFTYGLGSMLTSSLNVYLSSQITTLEKAFGFSSLRSGVLLSANDIGFLAAVLFASHFLKKSHIPRILAGCIVVFGITGVFTGVPQFIANIKMEPGFVASPNITNASRDISYLCVSRDLTENYTDHRCMTSHNGKGTSPEDSDHRWVLNFIFVLMVIQGVTKAPRLSLSATYVDSNSEKTKTGFYLGLLSTFYLFGPMLALTSGGLFSNLPIDLQDTTLTPEDPRWLGAWWLGFIIFGGAAVIVAIPLFFFKRGRTACLESNYTSKQHGARQTFCEIMKDMPKSIWRVVSNPMYVLLLLGTLAQAFGIMPMIVFGPKYLETQFNMPAWKANVILGVEKLVTTSLGTFLGGVITRKFKLNVAGCIKLIILVRIVCVCLSSLGYVFGCDNPPIHGIVAQNSVPLLTGHNDTCDCTNVQFLTMCVDGSQTYFSPCHAGCQTETQTGYTQCSMSNTGDVKPGICNTGCPYLIPYIVTTAANSLVGTLAIASFFVIVLRVVEERDRSLSIGFYTFSTALLVFLPGPILVGKLIDGTCLVWREKCGIQGSCGLYDIVDMRVSLVSVETGFRFASVLFSLLLYVYHRRYYKDDDTIKEETVETSAGEKN